MFRNQFINFLLKMAFGDNVVIEEFLETIDIADKDKRVSIVQKRKLYD